MEASKDSIQNLIQRGTAGFSRPSDGPILMEALRLSAKDKAATYIKMAMERISKVDVDAKYEAEGEQLMHDIEQLKRTRMTHDNLDVLLTNDSLGG